MAKKKSKKHPPGRSRVSKRWIWIPTLGIGALGLYCYWNAQSNDLPIVSGPDYPQRTPLTSHRQLSDYTVYHRLNRQKMGGVVTKKSNHQVENNTRLLPPEEEPQWSSGYEPEASVTGGGAQETQTSETKGVKGQNRKNLSKDTGTSYAPVVVETTKKEPAGDKSRPVGSLTKTMDSSRQDKKSSVKKGSRVDQPGKKEDLKRENKPRDEKKIIKQRGPKRVVRVIGIYQNKEKAVAVFRQWKQRGAINTGGMWPEIQQGSQKGKTLYRVVMMTSAPRS